MRIPKQMRDEALSRDNFTCRRCNLKTSPKIATITHINPVSKGGKTDISNLETLCPTCNFIKFSEANNLLTTPISEQLARTWIKLFTHSPFATGIITFIAILGITIGIYIADSNHKKKKEIERLESQNYTAQIGKLNETEQKIRELLAFVNDQRNSLRKTEEAISTLKAERDSLAPLVESQQNVVDALFAAQEKRNEKEIGKERWIGFGIGFLSSTAASIAWMIGRFFVTKNKKSADQHEG